MSGDIAAFYNDLAEHYHLIFEDWDRSIDRQASVLGPLLEARADAASLKVLDCACGIGTQTIGLAKRGHQVTGSDLSEAAIARARREAGMRGLDVDFHVADMRDLSSLAESGFDAVVAGDNALPHLLSDDDLTRALTSISLVLKPRGIFLATNRDYDALLQSRPAFQGPAFYSKDGRRHIVHQVWDWDKNEYTLHLYITYEEGSSWIAKHYATRYRALQRSELSKSLESSGFCEVEWLMPEKTGLYQPVMVARKKAAASF
ncbi:MAG TPA: class I SAM-dependent methyltransferase [Acidobacteriaceae bacterium]|nr:class I SAM-dependent methyltransferase [Acidobacteriaceae bacterium]